MQFSRQVAVILFLSAITVPSIFAQTETVQLLRDQTFIDFPESVDFRLVVTAESTIEKAELSYGVSSLSCGKVTAVYTPTFTPTKELDLTWRWPVLEGQLIPPGSEIWWQWQLTLASGETVQLPRKTAVFLDEWFVWQTIAADNITVHWYRGPHEIGEQILAAAETAVSELATQTGLRLTDPIHIYVYDESFDLRVSLPGAPAWAGGAAFPEQNVVLISANTDHMDYGTNTTRHEIGHLVVGRLTFNCTNSILTWLSEGLAMVAEGAADAFMQETLQAAIDADQILTIPQLEGSFPIHADRAYLSYAQSHSLVNYLIETYGQEKMLTLLHTFQAGSRPNDALLTVYDINTTQLEGAWRNSIGASPPPEQFELAQTATPIPTIALAAINTAVFTPTATATNAPTETAVPATATQIPVQPTPSSTQPTTLVNDQKLLLFRIGGGFVLLTVLTAIVVHVKRKTR